MHHLDRVLKHLRYLNVFKVNSISPRYFSTKSDSGGEDKNTAFVESPNVEKESQIETKNNVDSGEGGKNTTSMEFPITEKEAQVKTKDNMKASEFEIKLSGFARSYEKFKSINHLEKKSEIPQTFASLIRHSKLVNVSTYIYNTCMCDMYLYRVFIYCLQKYLLQICILYI